MHPEGGDRKLATACAGEQKSFLIGSYGFLSGMYISWEISKSSRGMGARIILGGRKTIL